MLNPNQRGSAPIAVTRLPNCPSYKERSHLTKIVSPQMKSRSIPITTGHFHRTASEIQLYIDEQIAEQRDNAFYARIVNGILINQSKGKNRELQKENELCLTSIIQTHKGQPSTPTGMLSLGESQKEKEYDDWIVGEYVEDDCNLTSSDESPDLDEDSDLIFDLDL
eukprot:Nitzschia sp. Nitz4//scaffold108_size72880//514//1011//NITZ4_005804-RA/size72880-processed-gene-0.53-mRNA-1//1//CDS//3329532636//6280//frame0